MAGSQVNWRKLIKGLTLIDMVVSIISLVFGVYSLFHIKLVHLAEKTDTDSPRSEGNYTQPVENLKTVETMNSEDLAKNRIKVKVIWAVFTVIIIHLFVLVLQIWISVKLFKSFSAMVENYIILKRSQLWRNMNMFQVCCCVLFLCLETFWTPRDLLMKGLLICLIIYRVACFVFGYNFVIEITPVAAERRVVEVSLFRKTNAVIDSDGVAHAPSSRGHIHKIDK